MIWKNITKKIRNNKMRQEGNIIELNQKTNTKSAIRGEKL